ncbi:tRNA (guanine(26)-N(2)/guanine(27)-N(2))-dimethyltransferase [archaeon HR06]|nr:tRNA (guanine(26)-N(2)/guanine(27)-N(2))-dimethyltransferase [archaeon HR06]
MEEFLEGKTKILVENYVWNRTPKAGEVFFNPFVKVVRDLAVLACKAYGEMYGNFLIGDALAGVGAKALRIAKEVDKCYEAHLNDKSYLALEYAKKSALENGIENKCKFTNYEASYFLLKKVNEEGRFDIVEIDPFGSPSPYLDAALKAVRDEGLLCLTATDVTALCGIYKNVALRRYFGYPINNEFNHEIAVRLLISSTSFMGARLDLGLRPLFSHFTRNHARVYLKVLVGANKADETLRNLGYLAYCFNCLYREFGREVEKICPLCKSKLSIAGPLWIGELHDEDFLSRMIKNCPKEFKEAEKIVKLALEEINLPLGFYKIDKICKNLKISIPKISKVIESLRSLGYKASRTIFDGNSIKCNISIKELKEILLKL